MTSLRKLTLQVCFVTSIFFNSALAAYIDFTDSTLSLSGIAGGFAGSVDGIGFSLTSTGTVTTNKDGGYDGSSDSHCQSGTGSLKCDRDGIGIENDEITMGQTLNLIFDTAVRITSIEFLDLYIGTGTEQVTVTIDGGTPVMLNATGSSGDGGYANLSLAALAGPGQNIAFTASFDPGLRDDSNNDYALAAITVSAVPIPAAAWLFGTALLGLVGFSRRRKTA